MQRPISKIAVTMKHGQMFHNVARNGKPKALTVPKITHSMRDVGKSGHGLAFVGGKRPLDDEPNDKLSQNARSVPVHNGMGSERPENRGADYGPDHGSKILRDAGPGSWISEPHGTARLPTKR